MTAHAPSDEEAPVDRGFFIKKTASSYDNAVVVAGGRQSSLTP
jgi:hypothetical protein